MVAILHNLVGLLHANMAIYYAYIDRAPVFIIGATGPMDETKRRPRIDWIHTALVQGEAVRPYTKWDYQPHTIDGVPESFARAYAVMMTEPRGPIYMCYDAWLQEQQLDHDVPLPPKSSMKVPAQFPADPAALARAAGAATDTGTRKTGTCARASAARWWRTSRRRTCSTPWRASSAAPSTARRSARPTWPKRCAGSARSSAAACSGSRRPRR